MHITQTKKANDEGVQIVISFSLVFVTSGLMVVMVLLSYPLSFKPILAF